MEGRGKRGRYLSVSLQRRESLQGADSHSFNSTVFTEKMCPSTIDTWLFTKLYLRRILVFCSISGFFFGFYLSMSLPTHHHRLGKTG
jgi:hypothetical protein